MSDNLMPHDLNREKSVLASILINGADCDRALNLLSPEDFHLEAHKAVFKKCRELSKAGNPIDIGVIASELEEEGSAYVRPSLLSKLLEEPISPDIEYSITKLKSFSRKRRAIEIGNAIIKRAHDSGDEKIQSLAKRSHLLNIEPSGDGKFLGLTYDISLKDEVTAEVFSTEIDGVEGVSEVVLIASKNDADY